MAYPKSMKSLQKQACYSDFTPPRACLWEPQELEVLLNSSLNSLTKMMLNKPCPSTGPGGIYWSLSSTQNALHP